MAERGQSVRVLYDYDYTDSKGNKISIKTGDECTLLKKSTEEWWSVLRKSEKKPIYVPANYVEALPKKSKDLPPKPAERPKKKGPPPPTATKPKFQRPSIEDEALKMLDAALEGEVFDDLDLDAEIPKDDAGFTVIPPRHPGEDKPNIRPDHNDNEDPALYDIPIPVVGGDDDDDINIPAPDYDDDSPPTRKKTEDAALHSIGSTGDSAIGSQDSLDKDVQGPTEETQSDLPDYANVRDIDDMKHKSNTSENLPDYANLADIQAVIHGPGGIPTAPGTRSSVAIATATTLVTDLEDDWELRKDNKTMKLFKFNRTTKEVDENVPQDTVSPGNSLERPRPEIRKISLPDMRNSGISEYSDRPPSSAGWRRAEDDTGEVFFVNDVKNKTRASWSIGDPSLLRKYPVPPLAPSRNTAIQEEEEPSSSSIHGNRSNDISPSGSVTSSLSRSGPISLSDVVPVGSMRSNRGNHGNRPHSEYVTSRKSPIDHLTPGVYRTMPEKKGYLFKTKSVENGKKIKKNWSKSFVVLQGGGLYFYPDQKASQPSTKHARGKYEFSIGLRGCSIDVDATREKSSRKNVMVLTTQGGVEFLLQDTTTTAAGAADWFPAIKDNITSSMSISHSGSVNSLNDLPEPLAASGPSLEPPEESRHSRKPSKKGVPPRPSTPDDLLATGEKNSKFKDWINRWLKNRPSYESVQQKGYIKDGVFGSHLQTLYDRTKYLVPAFVSSCLEAIEKRGLLTDGIYRVSGNLAQIQKLRFLVDKDEHYDLLDNEWDVHVIAGALKLFFRELREPLFPFMFFDKFIAAIQMQDKKQKHKTVKELVKMLPPANKKTLEVLCGHLTRVIEHSKENRMLLQNVAIVFGPTLMWPAVESQNIAITMVYQGQCVEYIVQEYKTLF